MATNAKDLTDQQFGWLTAVKPTGESGRRGVLWLLRCQCGREIIRPTAAVLKKPRRPGQAPRSCGCNKIKNRIYISKYGRAGDLSGHRFGFMKTGAKHRGHVFEVTIEYLWELFLTQDKTCVFTGLRLAMANKSAKEGEALASLDRIDSVRGYVVGNVQWVHPTINFMKHAMPQEHFIEWCRLVAKHLASVPAHHY